MERAVYFDAWYKHNYCQHPSLPLRSLHMIDDLEDMHATLLVWSAMGGGSISLPFLEKEAYGEVEPRLQLYGFMNDRDYLAECHRRGIDPFSIVFEVQGWEFPAEYDPATGRIRRMNKLAEREEDQRWYGLREFSSNEYPDAFPKNINDYYPDGIYNSDGELVTDLMEEATSRRVDGSAIHAAWVEVRGHKQYAYQVCRNNPVWRDYLKKIIAIQIDAGTNAVQLDECELPMTSMGSGGCFCKDCVKQFRDYIRDRAAQGLLGAEWDGLDTENFNYRDFLGERGLAFDKKAPFYKDYWEFQVKNVRKYFNELVDFAKSYGRERYGRKIRVSGNFYNLGSPYYPIEGSVDVVITEMEHTLFKQPYFYRYCAGFGGGKPVIITENPYGGIVPQLVKLLDAGRGFDLFRIFMLEAAMFGCNMSVPYGGWMGGVIKDAFWAPKGLVCQIQDFLYEHEDLFPGTPVKGPLVLYSYGSNYWREIEFQTGGGSGVQDKEDRDLLAVTADDWRGPEARYLPFWEVIRALSARQVSYDVRLSPDGDFREDDFGYERVADYPALILPGCITLTENQRDIILRYAKTGRPVFIHAETDPALLSKLEGLENVVYTANAATREAAAESFLAGFLPYYEREGSVDCSVPSLGVQRYDVDGRAVVHLMNYDYDRAADAIRPVPEAIVTLRDAGGSVRVYTLDGELDNFTTEPTPDGRVKVRLRDVPVYCVIECKK